MKRIAFIQGGGAGAHAEDEALAADLGEHFAVDYPEVPGEDDPSYAAWEPVISGAVAREPLAIVGHSLGGYFLLRWLAEHPAPSLRAICIIAAPFPSADPDWTFEGFELPDALAERLPAPVFLYASDDDEVVPFAHRDHYARALPAAAVRTTTGGHQLGGDLGPVAADLLRVLGAER